VIVVVAAAMKTAAATVEARTTAMAAMALVTIAPVALAIAHFIVESATMALGLPLKLHKRLF
jgi:hypothetical protein